jgi:hypothetical protein
VATLTEQFSALNNADLSKLRAKLDGLRADIESALKAQGKKADTVATTADLQAAAAQAGVSVDEFIAALEWAKKLT